MLPVRRRTVLLAPLAWVGGSLLSGCTESPAPPAPVDPDRAALADALQQETQLRQIAAQWDATTTGPVDAQSVATLLTIHIDTLATTLGVSPPAPATATMTPPSPSSTSTPVETGPVTTRGLAAAAARTARTHDRALRSLSPAAAQLLASLSASDATLARVLQAAP